MMLLWYRIVAILPFDWAIPGQMFFMKHALLAVLLVSPIYGILSTMIVNNRMAFFSDALGHGAFTGIVIGALFGFSMPLWSAVIFSILFSVVITLVRHKTKMANDTVIGVFSSAAIALGIFISTQGGRNFARLNRFLIGDILSITPTDIGLLLLVLGIVLVVWVFLFNRLLVVSINSSYASSWGINTLVIELIFTVLIAVIVTVSMQWIGLLVINSLLVLPGASARNITGNIRSYHSYALAISLLSGVGGLIISYYMGTSTGATIVLVSVCFFLLTFIMRSWRRFNFIS
jgi:zinc transport system permease protein